MTNDRYRQTGLKFYQFKDDSDTSEIIRLMHYDEEKHEYKVMKDGNTVTISDEELDSKWIKLNPDGVLVFALVQAKDIDGNLVPDLMVNLHRIDKDKNGLIEKMPYCTCRQAVIDIFALIQQSRYISGMCISKDTCPPEVDYRSTLAYEKMTKFITIAVYMDDHINDILGLFRHKSYDERLALIKARDKMGIQGYQTNLYDFLQNNYFMLDFHKAFDVHEIEGIKTFDFEDQNTNRVVTDYIIANTQEVPIKLYPIPYSKYIDLKDIKRKYILICPDSFKYPEGNITLVAYDVSQTISYKDLINGGKSPTEAKKEVMSRLGWS